MDLEKVRQRREEDAHKTAARQADAERQAKHNELKSSLDQVAEVIVKHKPRVNVENFPEIATSKDIKKLNDEIENFTLTTFISLNNALTEVTESLRQLADQFDSTKDAHHEGTLDAVDKLVKSIPKPPAPLKAVSIDNLSQVEVYLSKLNKDIIDAINNIKLNPRIEVASPEVSVPPIDFSPLIKALEPKETESKPALCDLNTYKAQDLIGDDVVQYIGFVAPDGGWYIVENDLQASSLRYKFGIGNYRENWTEHMNHIYLLLDEAIREVQT